MPKDDYSSGSGFVPQRQEKMIVIHTLENVANLEQPEQKLWFAVLERAIWDLNLKKQLTRDDKVAGYTEPYRPHLMATKKGFFMPDSSLSTVFEFICEAVDLDMEYVLMALSAKELL